MVLGILWKGGGIGSGRGGWVGLGLGGGVFRCLDGYYLCLSVGVEGFVLGFLGLWGWNVSRGCGNKYSVCVS